MHRGYLQVAIVLCTVLAVGSAGTHGYAADPGPAQRPPALYVMWQRDPTTTMTIHWHTVGPDLSSKLEFRAAGDPDWLPGEGTSRPMPYSDRIIHAVELTRLVPGTDYEFRLAGYGHVERFRTMPQTDREGIRFVIGGDCGTSGAYEAMSREVAKHDPDFAAIGGDIAYENGRASNVGLYYKWLDVWTREMVTPKGRCIPLVVAIGNHEVDGGYGQSPEKSPFFHALFSLPGGKSYGVLDFAGYMSLFLLDTGHIHAIDGEQTAWLARHLRARRNTPHLFAAYHVPGYPSHREYEGHESTLVREHWCPVFDEFGLTAAFEHHDHTYKRTFPIRHGNVDPQGVLYLGDGAWGQLPRPVHSVWSKWYLAASASRNHVVLVTLEAGRRRYEAIDPRGNVIDAFAQDPTAKTAAADSSASPSVAAAVSASASASAESAAAAASAAAVQ